MEGGGAKRRSLSAGATVRKPSLTINSQYTVSPKRRIKRLVLAPGQPHPNADNVRIAPSGYADTDPRAFATTPRGKRLSERSVSARAISPIPRGEHHAPKALVKRRPTKNTIDMLQHQDAECGLPSPSPRTDFSKRRPITSTRVTQLNRGEGEPLGLTIDENLMVTNVVEGTVAHRAGLKPGTRLTSVDGNKVATQDDAIDALRFAGHNVSVGLLNGGSAQHMKDGGFVAGVQTAYESQQRRVKRPDPTKEVLREAPFAGNPIPTPVPKPAGLGPPGLGPQAEPWGETGAVPESPVPYDSFKPNMYIPERSEVTPVKMQSNMTSYEVAEERGCVAADGTWDGVGDRYRPGKVQIKDQVERRNGDILVQRGPSESPATPRRGRDRGASPMTSRVPAMGPPMGDETEKPYGKKINELGGLNAKLLTFPMKREQQGGNSKSWEDRRALTPTRYRHTPEGHGDLIGNTYGRGDKASPRKTRTPTVHDFELPKVRPRSFTPTPRHTVASPAPSDIFCTTNGEGKTPCRDARDARRSINRGVSPRHSSSFELAHHSEPATPMSAYDSCSTPRRGRGTGSMAPPLPSSGYTPWGERE